MSTVSRHATKTRSVDETQPHLAPTSTHRTIPSPPMPGRDRRTNAPLTRTPSGSIAESTSIVDRSLVAKPLKISKKDSYATIRIRRFVSRFGLAECFTLAGFLTGLIMSFFFAIDLFFHWPFNGFSPLVDAAFSLNGFAVLYLTWEIFDEQTRSIN